MARAAGAGDAPAAAGMGARRRERARAAGHSKRSFGGNRRIAQDILAGGTVRSGALCGAFEAKLLREQAYILGYISGRGGKERGALRG